MLNYMEEMQNVRYPIVLKLVLFIVLGFSCLEGEKNVQIRILNHKKN